MGGRLLGWLLQGEVESFQLALSCLAVPRTGQRTLAPSPAKAENGHIRSSLFWGWAFWELCQAAHGWHLPCSQMNLIPLWDFSQKLKKKPGKDMMIDHAIIWLKNTHFTNLCCFGRYLNVTDGSVKWGNRPLTPLTPYSPPLLSSLPSANTQIGQPGPSLWTQEWRLIG